MIPKGHFSTSILFLVLSTSILVGAALPSEIEASVLAVQQGPLSDDLQQAIVDLGVPYGTY